MSAVLAPLPHPGSAAVPRPLLWTLAAFHRVNATGVFEGRRPILLRGVLLEQGPVNPPHATGVGLTTEALRTVFGVGWQVRNQLPLVLGLDTDPFPDVAVVTGG